MNANRDRTVATAVLAALAGISQRAQAATVSPGTRTSEEIVVTGTSIRGVAPVGSNLITVDRAQIESSGAQTIQQVLRTFPRLPGFGNSAQGAVGKAAAAPVVFQSFDGAGNYTPTIHGLGASASNGTLDPHRWPSRATLRASTILWQTRRSSPRSRSSASRFCRTEPRPCTDLTLSLAF